MGEYVFCPKGQDLPAILSSAHVGSDAPDSRMLSTRLFGRESLAVASSKRSASMAAQLMIEKAKAVSFPNAKQIKAERKLSRLFLSAKQPRLHLYQVRAHSGETPRG